MAPMNVRDNVNRVPFLFRPEPNPERHFVGEHFGSSQNDTVYYNQRQEYAQRIVERFSKRLNDELY